MLKRLLPPLFLLIAFTAFAPVVYGQAPESYIPELAARLNLWRLSQGLGPLVYNPTLELMAADQVDYVLSLSNIPLGGDIHLGKRGEDVRQRSQFDAFKWPTYGRPEFIAVSEIAAIGSVDTAMEYWQHSEIHTRAATNPTYREVGIAARKHKSDVLFMVVIGGRPDILPALADIDTGELYLTSERSTWQGEWIGEVIRYRLLDSESQPIQDWQDWKLIVPLPDTLETDTFMVEYEDGSDKRVKTEVSLRPVWSSIPVEQPAQAVVQASQAQTENLFATNTPVLLPTLAPTSPPTPQPGTVGLIYSKTAFTLIARSAQVNLNNVTFRNGGMQFSALDWESMNSDLNIGALSRNHCLQIWQQHAGDQTAPAECGYVRSVVFEPASNLFWAQGTFEVLLNSEVVATCEANTRQCEVDLS